ncbi:MAG: UDP-3-O-(3-hydroxymyristoyl)glucosamine N-acyltransferase [Pseudomonadota bacterium]
MEYSLKEIADFVSGDVIGDAGIVVNGIRGFDDAGESEITFVVTPAYKKKMAETKAAALIVPMDVTRGERPIIRVANPYLAFAKISALFHPAKTLNLGISSAAFIGEQFFHGEEVSIFPGVFIGNNVRIGSRVTLMPGVFLGDNVRLEDEVFIHPNVTVLERCRIGNRVIIHSGTVIGSDGFGFAADGSSYAKIPQVGIVRIDDDVEIGAANTIDRATLGETWIKRGVKTDNLVHIGHNVVIGEDTIIVAQVAVGGSAVVGSHVIIAGQAALSDHVVVGDNAILGPKSGIAHTVFAGEIVSGSPAMPHRTWLRSVTVLPRLPDMERKIRELEQRLQSLEKEKEDRDGASI